MGRTTCYLNRALRSQGDFSRCCGKPLLCFFTKKSTDIRISSFVSAYFLITRVNQRTVSSYIYLSFSHVSHVFRDHAFLFLFFSSFKKFIYFFHAKGAYVRSILFYAISGIIEFSSSQVNYPQERDLSRNHPFIGDNFVGIEKLRYSR